MAAPAFISEVLTTVAGLDSEQKALLDFIVLSQASSFVGFGPSTFSFYLKEYRSLLGVDRSSSVLVSAPKIGSDQLFQNAAVLSI